jgi:DNA-binding LacI/PurR family transcriptional regulator
MPESLTELGVLLRRPDRPTAIFASHDYRAKVIAEIAAEAGLRIPGDLELVGFGNTPWCEALPVSLTSVDLRLETLADEVVRAALGESVPGETRWIVPHLVLRQTCPAAPRGALAGEPLEE